MTIIEEILSKGFVVTFVPYIDVHKVVNGYKCMIHWEKEFTGLPKDGKTYAIARTATRALQLALKEFTKLTGRELLSYESSRFLQENELYGVVPVFRKKEG